MAARTYCVRRILHRCAIVNNNGKSYRPSQVGGRDAAEPSKSDESNNVNYLLLTSIVALSNVAFWNCHLGAGPVVVGAPSSGGSCNGKACWSVPR